MTVQGKDWKLADNKKEKDLGILTQPETQPTVY